MPAMSFRGQQPGEIDNQARSSELRTLEWDYTDLANSYVFRPNYSGAAIDCLLELSGPASRHRVIDLGAGTAHLTVLLAERGCSVLALEPNHAMRQHGVA